MNEEQEKIVSGALSAFKTSVDQMTVRMFHAFEQVHGKQIMTEGERRRFQFLIKQVATIRVQMKQMTEVTMTQFANIGKRFKGGSDGMVEKTVGADAGGTSTGSPCGCKGEKAEAKKEEKEEGNQEEKN